LDLGSTRDEKVMGRRVEVNVIPTALAGKREFLKDLKVVSLSDAGLPENA
jgi:hypothetical protein